MVDPSDELILITYDDEFGGSVNINVNIALSSSEATIEAAIEAALILAGIGYTAVFVIKTDLGGGLFHIFIEILNCGVLLTVASFTGGFDTGWTLTFCDNGTTQSILMKISQIK